jgi:putrescine aminotransferase
LEQVILDAGPDTVAAVVLEPVQGAGGVIVPPADYLPLVRGICDRHGVLLIADEVITGFGRTGRWFGVEHWNVVPDLMIFAKGVTSGYLPLSGVMLTGEVHRTLQSLGGFLPHGFTYSGHPTACAVALRNLQIIEDEGLVARVAEMGPKLQERLARLRSHPMVGDVRGIGLLAAVELVRDRQTKARHEPSAGVGRRVALHALADRVIVRALGGDVVALSPPFVVTEEQIDHVVEVLDRSIGKVEQELANAA